MSTSSDDSTICEITCGRIRYQGYAYLPNIRKRFNNRMGYHVSEAQVRKVWVNQGLNIEGGYCDFGEPPAMPKPRNKWIPKFAIRDLFWLTLVVSIVLSKYTHEPTHLECPCCGSMYDLETIRSVSDY
jgi:hypothetical protein